MTSRKAQTRDVDLARPEWAAVKELDDTADWLVDLPLATVKRYAGNTGSYEGRCWIAGKSITESKTAWLAVTLHQKRRINRVHVYAPSSTCGLPGLRDFQLLVHDGRKGDWRTVSTVADAEESWVFHLTFPEVETDKLKLLITDIDNGFRLDDRTGR